MRNGPEPSSGQGRHGKVYSIDETPLDTGAGPRGEDKDPQRPNEEEADTVAMEIEPVATFFKL